jgi:hypothetical protein
MFKIATTKPALQSQVYDLAGRLEFMESEISRVLVENGQLRALIPEDKRPAPHHNDTAHSVNAHTHLAPDRSASYTPSPAFNSNETSTVVPRPLSQAST